MLDRIFYDPSRLAILTILYQVEKADFLYLQKKCAFTPGNLNWHLAKLQAAGYVAMVKGFKGKYPITVCSMTSKGRDELEGFARKLSSEGDAQKGVAATGRATGSNKGKA